MTKLSTILLAFAFGAVSLSCQQSFGEMPTLGSIKIAQAPRLSSKAPATASLRVPMPKVSLVGLSLQGKPALSKTRLTKRRNSKVTAKAAKVTAKSRKETKLIAQPETTVAIGDDDEFVSSDLAGKISDFAAAPISASINAGVDLSMKTPSFGSMY